MLRSLHVRNYVLIDSLEIDFPAGLVIITGQTGAGKSILLGALSLALGGKADASMLGPSGDSCVVEACFDAAPDLEELFREQDLPWDGEEIRLRRVLTRSGRSRAFIADEPISLGRLQELSSRLVDVHSQHQTLLLKDKAYHRRLLDLFAGNGPLVEACKTCWERLSAARKELETLRANMLKAAAENDYRQALLEKLSLARLREGELEELEAEHKLLSGAEEIKETLYGVESMFSGEEDSLDSKLKEAVRLLSRISRYLPAAGELSSRLESQRLEFSDILSELENQSERIDVSPSRLEAVEQRLSLLYELMHKHSLSSVEDLIALRDSLSKALEEDGSLSEKAASLEKEIGSLEKEYSLCSAKLHEARIAAAEPFALDVRTLARGLEMEKAVLRVSVSPAAPSESGTDQVGIEFSATGGEPADLSRIASGGEMSRIMLCLKAVMARYSRMPSMVFDEIDTGVSGSAADKMGSLICEMGRSMQVFAITHLPQVAAKGDAHLLVSKEVSEDGGAHTQIRRISGEERVQEIARMLSGSSVTAAAVANARALIG